MTTLHSAQRGLLEKAVQDGRDASEKAADAALRTLAVHQDDPFAGMSLDDRQLRRLLRAEQKRLGSFDALIAEVAYAQWHRMLFARFLAENDLLMHPSGVPVSLAECGELAETEGEPDEWMVAAKYAALMLPGIFPNDDPLLRVGFDAFGRQSLEALIAGLPTSVFTADDALGWVYQFWQTKRKDQVNAKGDKIGGADLSPVTQLFTEPYMVQFLLHNSLGAWWATRHPDSPINGTLDYLRFDDDGKPAAGAFSGWPTTTRGLTVMDPSCGSGHFLQAAFDILRRMRMEEEGLSEAESGDAVLRDNLHGLELDPRCTQIATFAVALAAWKAGGYRLLPLPHIACSGLAVGGELKEWTRLAEPGSNLQTIMFQMYSWFKNAPDLGSLIDPSNAGKFKVLEPWDVVLAKLTQGLDRFQGQDDPTAKVFGDTARGTVRAAEMLFAKYHLVCTNVPYLARGKHGEILRSHLSDHFPAGKADLATAFMERCLAFCVTGGSTALVTPQNWHFQTAYHALRENLLKKVEWDVVARLGAGAFETITGEVVKAALQVFTNSVPTVSHDFIGIEADTEPTASMKAQFLRSCTVYRINQNLQLHNPDARIAFDIGKKQELLQTYAHGVHGLGTKDAPRFIRCFWEVERLKPDWAVIQSTTETTLPWSGMEHIVYWQGGCGILHDLGRSGWAVLAGGMAWGKHGVCVNQMGERPCTLYNGEIFDKNAAVVLPHNVEHLPAIWAYCSSKEFNIEIRRIDRSLKVTNNTLVKVPFDLGYWQKIADDQYPNGLPLPHSDDPTQWLFQGQPARSTDPLYVAVARLLGYHWPEHGLPDLPSGQSRQERDGLDAHADADGIVCLTSVDGEAPAADRLRALIAEAYGDDYSTATLEQLLSEVGYGGKTLDAWLRDGFAAGHCKLFQNRPFLWQVWDGRKDGFSAIVNYHTLDRQKLEKLTYRYLGDWITAQRDADSRNEAGANARLVAALTLQQKLQAILDGEPPYDIYIRWKPLSKQPIGWEPDLNDGIRMNIRPFVTAGVLRANPNVNWKPDRGKNPDGSERTNDLHYVRSDKEAALGPFRKEE